MEISKSDWQLFRERVLGWQEDYMEELEGFSEELIAEVKRMVEG